MLNPTGRTENLLDNIQCHQNDFFFFPSISHPHSSIWNGSRENIQALKDLFMADLGRRTYGTKLKMYEKTWEWSVVCDAYAFAFTSLNNKIRSYEQQKI